MAHEIEGNMAFFSRTPAWHDLGTVLENAPTIAEACTLAYPHTIVKLPLDARISVDGVETMHIPVSTHSAIVRDDGKTLGVVGSGYEIVQPSEAFEFFAPFLESGLVELESGGSLRDGKRMWALARVKDGIGEVVPGDEIKSYYLVYTSFDGSLRHGIMPTNVRVVCANTLARAMDADNGKSSYQFKHTRNIRTSIEGAKAEIACSLAKFKGDIEAYRSLAAKPCDDKTLETYVREVFEAPKNDDSSTRTENKIQHVIDMTLLQPREYEYARQEGTYWNAYNGVTRYLQHEHGRSDDSRVDNLWFGKNAELSSRALEIALRA